MGTSITAALELLLQEGLKDGDSAVARSALARRSVRYGFAAGLPTAQDIAQILAAGLAAPSSKNAQPWCFHVVTCGASLDRMANVMKEQDGLADYVPVDPITGKPHERFVSTVVESAEVLKEVPLAFFIENRGEFSNGRHALVDATPQNLQLAIVGYGLEMLGLGGAIQNMWLTAIDLGLSGVFMGDVLIAEEFIREELGMGGDLVGVLALGRTDVSEDGPREHSAINLAGRFVDHPGG